MSKRHRLFSSESVTEGHPDKIADQISDGVLDAIYKQDKYGRVACEVMVTTGMAIIAGEITTTAQIEVPKIARDVIRDIGYTDASYGFDYETQHSPGITGRNGEMTKAAKSKVVRHVIKPVLPPELVGRKRIDYFINPTGRFVVGGPQGDCGVTGRKIIVDTYGGMGRHGGGAFSGKDPSKVDRSAAYMMRHVAKNIVAARLAKRCETQVAYAIGVAKPVSVYVDTFGTGVISDERLAAIVLDNFDFRPAKIIEYLKLRRPIYKKTAAYGHFGREERDFTWERVNRAKDLRKAAKTRSKVR